jgi:hypothetical protein
MTYRELGIICNSLDPDQLDMDVSVAVVRSGSVDEVVDGHLVNPLDMGDNPRERSEVYLDEVCGQEGDDSILDHNCPYITAFIG